jgi:hypothetical protein
MPEEQSFDNKPWATEHRRHSTRHPKHAKSTRMTRISWCIQLREAHDTQFAPKFRYAKFRFTNTSEFRQVPKKAARSPPSNAMSLQIPDHTRWP